MTQHTKEPWRIIKENCQVGDIGAIHGEDGWYSINSEYWADDCAEMSGEANARRIVACVNACANIPIEHLEKHGHEFLGFYVQQRDVEQIIQRRDQLQNAINEIKQYIEDYPLDMGLDGFVKSVIAKIGADL